MKKFINWITGPKSDFILLIILLVLINLVGANSFFRLDLTSPKSYSLSQSSKEVVKNLEEPLSVKVFFSNNLPSPYNTVEQYLEDILVEYKGSANKNFSYEFFDMDKPENEELASSYRIRQKQIQEVKDNEVGFKNVYMGVVLVYADSIEVLDDIISPDGLEYRLTTTMSKMINTTSALAGLKDNVNVTLYSSSDLSAFGIKNFNQLENIVSNAVAQVNKKNMNKVSFKVVNPNQDEVSELCAKYGVDEISWTDDKTTDESKKNGKGMIAAVMEYNDNFKLLPVKLSRSFFGSYGIAGLENLETVITENLQTLVSRSDKIGYLTGFGTKDLNDAQNGSQRLQMLTNDKYQFVELDLEKDEIPSTISNIVIVAPTEKISEKVFYKLDQFLMQGGNLTVFADMYKEVPTQNQYQLPEYKLLETGLPEFLAKYGIELGKDYVMDMNCYKNFQQGYGEIPMYYVPITERSTINQKNPITKNLSYILMFQNSSINLNLSDDVKGTVLVKSSDQSWLMKDNIIMHPLYITPVAENERSSYNLAVLAEGKFASQFDKNILEQNKNDVAKDSLAGGTNNHLAKAVQNGKIFVAGSSVIVSPMLIDDSGREPISIFVRNVLDYMNGNEDLCTMRTKGLALNTLKKSSTASIKVAKIINQYGVPLLVIIIGFIVWRMRVEHRKKIRIQYASTDERETMSMENKKEKKNDK
ncbi:MAG: Gldg family protein [Treponemataceae bacterium]|nr:Gldg family protein [Treponemataceae bacterium]